MGGGISKMAKQELVATVRDRYQQASKKDKGRILDEFTAIAGHHRKHGIRLLSGTADNKGKQAEGRRIYDDSVREAVIVVWCLHRPIRPRLPTRLPQRRRLHQPRPLHLLSRPRLPPLRLPLR